MLSHHKKTLESYLSSVFSFFVMLAEVSASPFPSGITFAEPSASPFPSGITFAEPSASPFPSWITFAEPSASHSRAESHLRNLPQVIPERNHICGTFRKHVVFWFLACASCFHRCAETCFSCEWLPCAISHLHYRCGWFHRVIKRKHHPCEPCRKDDDA